MIEEEALMLVATFVTKTDTPEQAIILKTVQAMKKMRERIEHLETIETTARRFAHATLLGEPVYTDDHALLLGMSTDEFRKVQRRVWENETTTVAPERT